jgi:diguanylate cyclase (GGDEF)-like protein
MERVAAEDAYRGPTWWTFGSLRGAARPVAAWWLVAAAVAVGLALVEARLDWSGLPLTFGGVTVGFTIYPPLTVALLLAIWLGPPWGMVPAFLATLASALSVGIAPHVAAVFALATPLEVLILWGSMVTLNISPELRRWRDLRRFLAAGLIAASASSIAVLIWSDARQLGLAQSQRLWQGWLLGDLAQIALVVAPILRFAGPTMRAGLDRRFEAPPRHEFSYRASVLLTLLVSVILVGVTALGVQLIVSSLDLPPDARTASGQPLVGRLREVGLFIGLLVTVLLVTTGVFSASMARLGDRERSFALRDSLTGCFNRRGFYRLFRREADRSRRLSVGLSLVSLDIDNFKGLNDAFGHAFGDEVLKQIAYRLRSLIRENDLLFRWGGEEFVILLAHTAPGDAGPLAERVRDGIASTPFVVGEGQQAARVTVSLGTAGIASWTTTPADADDLVARADAALLQAKRAGRNRVVHESASSQALVG